MLLFKGIVHSKIKMYSPSGHARCRWDHFFIRTDLEKFSIASLAHQWITNGSEWVPILAKILKSPIHCFLQWKKSCINQEKIMHRLSTIYKHRQSKTVLNKYVGHFWCERKTGDKLFHWRKHCYGLWTCILIRSDGNYKLKCLNDRFVSYKVFHFTRC